MMEAKRKWILMDGLSQLTILSDSRNSRTFKGRARTILRKGFKRMQHSTFLIIKADLVVLGGGVNCLDCLES